MIGAVELDDGNFIVSEHNRGLFKYLVVDEKRDTDLQMVQEPFMVLNTALAHLIHLVPTKVGQVILRATTKSGSQLMVKVDKL